MNTDRFSYKVRELKSGILLLVLVSFVILGCKRETPVSCFTVEPIEASVGDSVVFDMSCSENTPYFSWDFGDGTSGGTNSLLILHSFSEAGEYKVTLRTCEHAMWYKWKTRCDESSRTIIITE
ncbi:MAG: PKD domain-containing protein [Flavobacteriales bacterium]|nr:PKD domain-containing protein [Flavobacteriales bacterium]